MSNTQSVSTSPGMKEWRLVWLKAIAEAWSDPQFEQALLTDARSALKSRFQYELPPGLNLKVVPSGAPAKWVWKNAEEAKNWPPPPGEAHIPLPPKPTAKSQGVALAELVGQHGESCCHDPCL